jgi:magnesium transporter
MAGIYGMNFEDMPDLKWSFGYPLCLVVMGVIAGLMTYWLSRRGWFQDWTTSRS